MNVTTTKNSTRTTAQKIFGWLLVTAFIGVGIACGGRIGKMDFPVGLTILVHPSNRDAVKPFEEQYPHIALQIMANGQPLSFAEDFELVLVRDPARSEASVRLRSAELAAAVKDTRCTAGVAAMATDSRAVFCGQSLPIAKAGMFLLVRPDGRTKAVSSYTSGDLDDQLGVRPLTLSF